MPYPEYFSFLNPMSGQWGNHTALDEDTLEEFQVLLSLSYAYAHAEGKTISTKSRFNRASGPNPRYPASVRWEGVQTHLSTLTAMRVATHV